MPFDRIWRTNAQPAAASAAGEAPLRARLARIPPPLRLFGVMMAIFFVWYGVIGTIRAGIVVDMSLRPAPEQLPPGGSVAVGMAARILDQQVNERAFTPNDPIFYPTGLARRTPAFQSSLVGTISSAVAGLASADRGADLAAAAESLLVPPETWWLQSGMPPVGLPAERHYRRAIGSLADHNRVIASKPKTPSPAPRALDPGSRAALAALLEAVETEAERGDRIIRDTESGSPTIQLASARGTAYAAALIMRGLRDDNSTAIRLSGRAARWGEALDALDSAARLDPMVARQGDLVKVGYSLLLAGNAMRAILEGQG